VRSFNSRNTRSSFSDGGAAVSTTGATFSGQPVFSTTFSAVTPGCKLVSVSSRVTGSGVRTPRSVITAVGPFPGSCIRSRLSPPSMCPLDVRKSSLFTNARLLCRNVISTSLQHVAISGAPPAPGKRVDGLRYSPITVVLMLANRSICAAPKNPRSMRPPCSQYANISGTDTTASAVSASSPSPIDSGSTEGLVPIVPDS